MKNCFSGAASFVSCEFSSNQKQAIKKFNWKVSFISLFLYLCSVLVLVPMKPTVYKPVTLLIPLTLNAIHRGRRSRMPPTFYQRVVRVTVLAVAAPKYCQT